MSGHLLIASLIGTLAASPAPVVPAAVTADAPCPVALADAIRPEYLDACRPEAIGDQQKAAVLASLPPDGEITTLNADERRTLESLKPVLQVHARDGVYALTVIDVPQAWIGLHGRAVLLISRPLLTLVNAEELQALAAHEVGHEYQWAEREATHARQDMAHLRQLELACDVIAVLTLERLGLPPDRLVTAIEKLFQFNRDRFGIALNEDCYPSLKDRRKAIQRLTRATAHRARR